MASTDDLTAVSVLPILVVDDRQENLSALDGVLEPLGYPLLMARSGHEALRLLLEHDVALILLDVRMPELDGVETAQLIKGRARTRDVPIVFLTAANDDIGAVLRGYGVGAVDYVLKPFEPDVLRSKVAVFAELEKNRRALKRSETFLRAAFEAAPIGKTMLDGDRAIVRSNTAFARLVGREPAELEGVQILELCHPEDRDRVSDAFDRVAEGDVRPESVADESLDLRVLPAHGTEVWVGLVASSIEPADLSTPLLLAQWVDLSSRRRAEEARAELLMEHAARTHAEAMAERLSKLQALSGAIESLSLHRVLAELAVRLAELFDAQAAEVEIIGHTGEPITFHAEHGTASRLDPGKPRAALEHGHEVPIVIEGAEAGVLRMRLPAGRSFTSAERSLMQDAAERAALGIRRAQLHEREHQVAVELQRGLLPKQLPAIAGLELAAHYEAAGAEVGGDWYDAFALPGGRLGVVLGDVAGRGVPAASSMGQLRSVTRAFALADDGFLTPGGDADAAQPPPACARPDRAVHGRLRDHRSGRGHDLVGHRRSSAATRANRRRLGDLPRGRGGADGDRGHRLPRSPRAAGGGVDRHLLHRRVDRAPRRVARCGARAAGRRARLGAGGPSGAVRVRDRADAPGGA